MEEMGDLKSIPLYAGTDNSPSIGGIDLKSSITSLRPSVMNCAVGGESWQSYHGFPGRREHIPKEETKLKSPELDGEGRKRFRVSIA